MDPKLKFSYFLSVSVACLMAASCNTDVPDGKDAARAAEVSFDVCGNTRASATPVMDKFVVYGDKIFPDDDDENASPDLMFDKTIVEYKNGKWTYDGVQYWFPKHEHSFVAIHPVSALDADISPRYSDSRLSFTYKIPTNGLGDVADRGDVQDILAATHRRLFDEEDAITTTTFRFDHVMSKINLVSSLEDNVMEEDDFIEFHGIELTGFKSEATFSILPAPRLSNLLTDDRLIEVAGHDVEGRLTIELTPHVKVFNDNNAVTLLDDASAILMIPQDFAGNSEARIILSYTVNDDPTIKRVAIPLGNQSWAWGKSYTYRFKINRTGMVFSTTSITDWDRVSVGNIDAH